MAPYRIVLKIQKYTRCPTENNKVDITSGNGILFKINFKSSVVSQVIIVVEKLN